MLWISLSSLFYYSFRQQLSASFADELKAGAAVVAGKVNINPRIVPLPHGAEKFSIIYATAIAEDTLYSDESLRSVLLQEKDTTFRHDNFRGIVATFYPENGGSLRVLYALPSDSIDRRIRLMLLLIFISIPVGSLLAGLLGMVAALYLLMTGGAA